MSDLDKIFAGHKPLSPEEERQNALRDVLRTVEALSKVSDEDKQIFFGALKEVAQEPDTTRMTERSMKDHLVIRALHKIQERKDGDEIMMRLKDPFYLVLSDEWFETFGVENK